MQAREMNDAMKSLRQTLCTALSSGISGASHSTWEITPSDQSAEKPDASDATCFRFRFQGSLDGVAFLVVSNAVLWKLTLRDVDESSGDVNAARGAALLRALQGGTSGLGESLTAFGTVRVEIESVDGPDLPGDQVFELWARSDPNDSNNRESLHLCLGGSLVAALQAASVKPFVFSDAVGSTEGANLDLVMDVELNVTLRFGQRQLALRDVLDLASGSVVELDRLVDEPVELILDGRVVARGEAVIIDGNYGMRITEVLQQIVM